VPCLFLSHHFQACLSASFFPQSLLLIAFSHWPRHGVADQGAMDDLYKLDLNHLKWILVSSATGHLPSARYNHGFTASFGKMYLFGGKSFGRGNVFVFLKLYLKSFSIIQNKILVIAKAIEIRGFAMIISGYGFNVYVCSVLQRSLPI
jgi:hypothetical protein